MIQCETIPPPSQLCSLPETFQDAERKATIISASVLRQKNRRIQNGPWRTFRGFSAVVRSAERASSERKSRRPEGVNALNCFRPEGLDISTNKTKPPLPPQPLTNKLQAGEKKQLETRYFQIGCMTLVGALNPNRLCQQGICREPDWKKKTREVPDGSFESAYLLKQSQPLRPSPKELWANRGPRGGRDSCESDLNPICMKDR